MSPVSRGRRTKSKKKSGSLDPGLRAGFEDALEAFEEVATTDDVLDVELLAAEILSGLWLLPDARDVGFALVTYAAAKQTPAGLGLVRAVRELGPVELVDRAAEAGDRLTALGMREPLWLDALREITVTECWQQADEYGDETFLLFRCERAGRPHGLVVVATRFGGVEEVYLTTQEDEILAELREEDDPILVTERIPLSRAHRILEDALTISDAREPEDDDPLPDARAYIEARLRALPEPDEIPAPKPVDTTGFLPLVAEVPHAEECLRLLVEFGEEIDEDDPLRVSPDKFELFFAEVVEDLDDDVVRSMREVALAFAKWQGVRAGLSETAVERLLTDVTQIAGELLSPEIPIALRSAKMSG